jgi:predicted acyltransferase
MVLVPVPGIGEANLNPGTNLAAWIDSKLLPGTMWQGTWDPEGLLSTLPAIVTGITGMLAGLMIVGTKTLDRKIIWLFTVGFLVFITGGVWDWFFPINKNLWTSSYVLYTSGAAALTLATSMFVVDVLKISKWTTIGRVFGANAISAYVFAGMLPALLSGVKVSGHSFNSLFMDALANLGIEPKLASLLYAIMFVAICYIPVHILYKKKVFIKL